MFSLNTKDSAIVRVSLRLDSGEVVGLGTIAQGKSVRELLGNELWSQPRRFFREFILKAPRKKRKKFDWPARISFVRQFFASFQELASLEERAKIHLRIFDSTGVGATIYAEIGRTAEISKPFILSIDAKLSKARSS